MKNSYPDTFKMLCASHVQSSQNMVSKHRGLAILVTVSKHVVSFSNVKMTHANFDWKANVQGL